MKKYFKKLSEVDKLRLAIHLLESNYLHSDIDRNYEIQKLEKRLIELDNSYATTIMNFNKYKVLTSLSAMFIELSKYDKDVFITEMLDNL